MGDDPRTSNWTAALESRQLELLGFVIKAITEHEQQTGRVITPVQLRLVLERGWP